MMLYRGGGGGGGGGPRRTWWGFRSLVSRRPALDAAAGSANRFRKIAASLSVRGPKTGSCYHLVQRSR